MDRYRLYINDKEDMVMKRDLRDLNWTFVPLAGFLFAFGGWCCKFVRRELLPGIGGLLAWAYGVPLWRCVAYALASDAAFRLGYSPQTTPWYFVLGIGALYGLTPFALAEGWLRRKWWALLVFPLACGVWFVGLMQLSLSVNAFTWKFVEALVGASHGFVVGWIVDERRRA
jgi:hypothetical protein